MGTLHVNIIVDHCIVDILICLAKAEQSLLNIKSYVKAILKLSIWLHISFDINVRNFLQQNVYILYTTFLSVFLIVMHGMYVV